MEKHADMPPLRCVVYAGPNGSGKSSMIAAVESTPNSLPNFHLIKSEKVINPDAIANSLKTEFESPEQKSARERLAQQLAITKRRRLIDARESFAFETVMSHPSRISEMLLLKQNDYHLQVYFVSTNDPNINVARVAHRVESQTTTGHNVDPKKIVQRYWRSLQLLPKAIETANETFVFDNSIWGTDNPIPQASINDDGIALNEPVQTWVTQYVVAPLTERISERLQLVQVLSTEDCLPTELPNELNGQYVGPITHSTKYFFVVNVGRASIIADKTMWIGEKQQPNLSIGTKVKIRYSEWNAPTIETIERSGPARENISR